MKTHTSAFKTKIKKLGRELDSVITYELNGETIELGNTELNSVSPYYEGGILKSVMKVLDIDSNIDIPLETVINYQFGIKVRNDNVQDYRDNYDYIDFGNYVVYKSEKQEDTNSYKIICYDKMLYSMKEYENLNITYPITIRNYISAIANYMNVDFANETDTFANYDKQIPNELYLSYNSDTQKWDSLGYTFRDVLDELAEVTASTICINDDDELEIRYITNSGDTIDEEYLKDINVNFGKQYGPVNTIVLSRSAGADNIYYPSTLPQNPVEIKIVDNQIMNGNNRDTYLPEIYSKLNGLQYYINNYTSTGICYYELCDRYNVTIGENTYSCIMLNDSINITSGLKENIYTEIPEESVTDYTKADTTDRKINQTQLIVDKQQGIIDSLVSNTTYISNTTTGTGNITLENAYEGQLYKLSISGNISLLYPQTSNQYGYALTPSDALTPSNSLVPSNPVPYQNEIHYPSSQLFSKSNVLLIDDKEYKLDFDFLNYMNTTTYDEFIYDNGSCYIIRRVGIDSQGDMYALDNEVIEPKKSIILEIKESSSISLKSFPNAILSATYLLQNTFTDNFATEVYVQSEIKQTADSINLEVSTKVDEEDFTGANIMLKVNGDTSQAQINADKISLTGKEINLTTDNIEITSNNFSVDNQGNMTCKNATFRDGDVILTNNNNLNILEIERSYDTQYDQYIANIYVKGWAGEVTHINKDYVNVLGGDGLTQTIIYSDSIECSKTSGNDYYYVNIDSNGGNIDCTGTVTSQNGVCQGSKEEIKKNIKKYNNALETIKNIDIYKYNLKTENNNDKKHIGFVIGDNYKYSKDITTQENDGADLYSFISVCCKAIQEQQAIIEDLTKRIEKLERESDK